MVAGVDISEPALDASRSRAEGLGLTEQASYALGNFSDLPVADAAADGCMSIDALLFAPDKQVAVDELAAEEGSSPDQVREGILDMHRRWSTCCVTSS